jgi:hypothetical protein
LLQLSCQGNWKVLPEIGFYKQAHQRAYMQARWEKMGGILPLLPHKLTGMKMYYGYHRVALRNIEATLQTLDVNKSERTSLLLSARIAIWGHLFQYLSRFKVRPF